MKVRLNIPSFLIQELLNHCIQKFTNHLINLIFINEKAKLIVELMKKINEK